VSLGGRGKGKITDLRIAELRKLRKPKLPNKEEKDKRTRRKLDFNGKKNAKKQKRRGE